MKKTTIYVLLCSFFVYVNISANTAYTGMRGLTAMQITADMGAGINLCNTLDAYPTETSWGNPAATLALITAWRQKGFKTLRLPVTWKDHLGAAPNYTIDPTWFARVETVANYAFANDMYVILNAHHEDWYQPTTANDSSGRDKLTKVWTQIANRFKGYSDYLIFETMNEPRVYGAVDEWTGGNAGSRAIINAFNLAAVNAIRNTGGNNATRCIMTPTYGANGSSAVMNDLVIPNNDSLVIVSIHNYNPYDFCLNTTGTPNWGTATDKAALSADFDLLYNKFIKNGRAVVLGEWGAENKNNTSALVTYYDYFVNTAKSRQIATVNWMYVFNRNTLTWGLPAVTDVNIYPFRPDYVAVTGITLGSTSASVRIQDTVQLSVNIIPSNASNKAFIWSSSNTTVASVNSSGLVIGKVKGSATITATTNNGGFRATFALTVTNISVSSISITPIADTIKINEKLQINPVVLPSNATVKTVLWTSSIDAVATVDLVGLVIGKSKGTTTITAKTLDGGQTSTCTIVVEDTTTVNTSETSHKTSNNISLYPNPLNAKQLTIELSNFEGKTAIQIINLNGKVVSNQIIENTQRTKLDVDLRPGVYIVQFANKQNTVIKKLMIE